MKISPQEAFLVLGICTFQTGCQGGPEMTPAKSAVPALESATKSLEVVKVEATKTATALNAASTAPTLPAAKVEVSKAQTSNNAALEAAGGAAVAVAEAKPLAAAHEKNEGKALEAVQEAKDADDKETKWWLRVSGTIAFLSGAGGAYLFGQAGSILRAGYAAAAGIVIAAGCFWAASHLLLIWDIVGWTLALVAIAGVVAAILHYRKHGGVKQAEIDARDELLDGLARVVKSPALGAVGSASLTDPATLLHLEGTLSEEAKALLAKLK